MTIRAAILTDLGRFEEADAQWIELETVLAAAGESERPHLEETRAGRARTHELRQLATPEPR